MRRGGWDEGVGSRGDPPRLTNLPGQWLQCQVLGLGGTVGLLHVLELLVLAEVEDRLHDARAGHHLLEELVVDLELRAERRGLQRQRLLRESAATS